LSGFLFDTNVLIDLATSDQTWLPWSERQFSAALLHGPVCIHPIIYAECAANFPTEAELDRWFSPAFFQRRALPFAAAWLAATAFKQHRRAGGARSSPLPDFFIGAHAEVEGLTLVARDASRYRTYFPRVTLITP
jgi:hypothetical protein